MNVSVGTRLTCYQREEYPQQVWPLSPLAHITPPMSDKPTGPLSVCKWYRPLHTLIGYLVEPFPHWLLKSFWPIRGGVRHLISYFIESPVLLSIGSAILSIIGEFTRPSLSSNSCVRMMAALSVGEPGDYWGYNPEDIKHNIQRT